MQHLIIISLSLISAFSCASSIEPTQEKLTVDSLITETNVFEDTSTVNGITFAVDSVEIASERLSTDSAKVVISQQLRREISYMPQAHLEKMIAPIRGNGLISTVHECYDNHRPLILSPDAIWLAICQGVAIHIKENFDSLDHVIFKENHPDQLVARNDSLENDAEQWNNLIADLSDQTIEYSKQEIYDFFVPQFSTTDTITTTVYQINLLESFEKAFTYVGESGCGIPSIHLEGYKRDWMQIYAQLNQLDDFGLTEWKEVLQPIISEFIHIYDGKINQAFWQDIYKNAIEYGAFYVSGWIIKFFPYLETTDDYDYEQDFDDEIGAYSAGISYKPNPYLKGNDYLMGLLTTDDFPSGISKINLKWKNYFTGETTDMVINGGFFGMEQFEDKSLKPFITWAIHEKEAAVPVFKNRDYHPTELEHVDDFWSPKIITELQNLAIYDANTFNDQASSLVHIKSLLKDAISNDPLTASLDLTGLSVSFVVLMNGEIAQVKLEGNLESNTELLQVLKNKLKNLPQPWLPAMADSKDMLTKMGGREDNPPSIKVKANSLVVIVF
ncbi:MAG: hypothetical protein ACI8ZM_000124 [Crocinitomix sp.]|jgi:hypothetical protein